MSATVHLDHTAVMNNLEILSKLNSKDLLSINYHYNELQVYELSKGAEIPKWWDERALKTCVIRRTFEIAKEVLQAVVNTSSYVELTLAEKINHHDLSALFMGALDGVYKLQKTYLEHNRSETSESLKRIYAEYSLHTFKLSNPSDSR